MFNKIKLSFFVCLLIASSTFAYADPFKTKESTFSFLKEIYNEPGFLSSEINSTFGNTRHRKIYSSFFKSILQNDEVIMALAELVIDNKHLLDQQPDLAKSLASSWSLSTAMKGISRLPNEDQRFFIEMTLLQVKILDIKTCAKMFNSEMTNQESTEIGLKAMEQMPSTLVKAYLDIMTKALFAEIRDNPMKRILSVSETEIANAAFEEAYIDALINHEDSENLITASLDPKRSTDKYICENGMIILDSMLELKGFTGDLVVRNFISQLY